MMHCLWSCCLLSPAWSLDRTAAAAPRGRECVCGCVCGCVCVCVSGWEWQWGGQAGGQNWAPLSIGIAVLCLPQPPAGETRLLLWVFLLCLLTHFHPPPLLPMPRAARLWPGLFCHLWWKKNQFHLLSWEALSCCWLLHQTMALPLTPSQLLFSSGAGTLHVCCFVTAWWMLSDDSIPRRKPWD